MVVVKSDSEQNVGKIIDSCQMVAMYQIGSRGAMELLRCAGGIEYLLWEKPNGHTGIFKNISVTDENEHESEIVENS